MSDPHHSKKVTKEYRNEAINLRKSTSVTIDTAEKQVALQKLNSVGPVDTAAEAKKEYDDLTRVPIDTPSEALEVEEQNRNSGLDIAAAAHEKEEEDRIFHGIRPH